ncbi:MAG: hypothetical protein GEU71_09375 [Actinobacteria bacterium]|nr:hypothetical protein [Actinomycetota bacterium]
MIVQVGGIAMRFGVRIPPDLFEPWWTEFVPNAFTFTDSMRRGVPVLLDHAEGVEYGHSRSGSLQFSQDETGLRYAVGLDTEVEGVPALLAEIESGAITGVSLGWGSRGERWNFATTPALLTVTRATVDELSFAREPRAPGTSVEILRATHA